MKITYYFDALCGWCYGFSPVISQLAAAYQDKVELEVVSGGLFLGHRAGPVNEVAPHIKAGAYRSVESHTGVKFGERFLTDVFDNGTMTLNSLPPAIALCIVKEKYPEQAIAFAATLLRAVYSDGMNPVTIDEYEPYVTTLGFDFTTFAEKMKDSKYLTAAQQEFEQFGNSPFSGMPALVVTKGGQDIPLSSGYTRFEDLKAKLDQLLKN